MEGSALASQALYGDCKSSLQWTASCLDSIERYNSRFRAVITSTRDIAEADSQVAEQASSRGECLGPLHGVPIGIKDMFPVVGHPVTFGSAFFSDEVASRDAEVVRHMRGAGAGDCFKGEHARVRLWRDRLKPALW